MMFEGMHALVTGGSSGIGRATAIALAAHGCRVTATGVFERELDACRADDQMRGVCLSLLDVRDESGVRRLIESFDRLDVLVNCAGVVAQREADYTPEGFARTIDINLNGTMRCCYAAHPLLVRRGGSIVNIASVMAFFGSASGPAYSSSKGAVVQLTKSLAVGWGPQGVRVNAVAPGWVETPMTAGMQADPERTAKVVARTPQGRWGRPEEIAAGIVFLASPEASFVNGAVLPIDGGYLVTGI
jgi:NAD(P)-dependent dehydrogenase (short-subunit alcohol dehydrogenase family)